LEGSRLARAVHDPRPVRAGLFAMTSLSMMGCIIPPSLSVENQDAGINSPPAILAVRSDQQELPEPGPVTFVRGSTTEKLQAELIDTDLGDTLFVKVFVDYTITDPTAPRSECTAAPTMSAKRTVTCGLQALCLTADVGETRKMNVVVFDREPLEAGTPPFKAMPEGGLSTSRYFDLKCQEPPS
jgi:hypothetical protein